MIEYIINSAAWSLGGLCLGFLLGRLTREVDGQECPRGRKNMAKKSISKYDLAVGLVVFLLCTGFLYQSVENQRSDKRQSECVVEKFRELSVSLDKRADLTNRETSQNKKLWLIYAEAAGLIQKQNPDNPDKGLTDKQRLDLNKRLVSQLLTYRRVITQIETSRKNNPVPPYPVGACTDDHR